MKLLQFIAFESKKNIHIKTASQGSDMVRWLEWGCFFFNWYVIGQFVHVRASGTTNLLEKSRGYSVKLSQCKYKWFYDRWFQLISSDWGVISLVELIISVLFFHRLSQRRCRIDCASPLLKNWKRVLADRNHHQQKPSTYQKKKAHCDSSLKQMCVFNF